MGTTSVLRAVCRVASGFQILPSTGVEAESAVPMAGLRRLLRPLVRSLAELPSGHTDVIAELAGARKPRQVADLALCTTVHRMIVELSRARPVLVCIDDVQCLDEVSLAVLAFVARRASTERIAVVFAGKLDSGSGTAGDPLAGIRRMLLAPLSDEAARDVLTDHVGRPLAPDIAADLVELASGNPLALVELADSLTPDQILGDIPAPASVPVTSRLCRSIHRRLAELSEQARLLVLMAVVDEQLAVDTVLPVVEQSGSDLGVLDEAIASGLVVLQNDTVVVGSRLMLSIVRAAASDAELRAAHVTLAGFLDTESERLRQMWHRAVTDNEARDQLAKELSEGATDARVIGNHSTASTAFERAASLVGDPDRRATWLIDAAQDAWIVGGTRRARALLRQAAPLTVTVGAHGRMDLVRGVLELRDGAPAAAAHNLRAAAEHLLDHDRHGAITALMLAGESHCVIGDYAGFTAVAARVAELREPAELPATEIIFEHFLGMTATYQARHEDAVRPLARVMHIGELNGDVTSKILASQAAYTLGNVSGSLDLALQAVSGARASSQFALLPWALGYVALSALLLDRHTTAMSAAMEGLRESRAIGHRNGSAEHLTILALLAALQGDRETARLRMDESAVRVAEQGIARAGTLNSWALACLDLADERPADALERLGMLAANASRVHMATRVMAAPHVVEAAVQCEHLRPAQQALQTFDRWVGESGCAPRLALSHRCHALLADGFAEADEHFKEAIRWHRRSETALELAKTELAYGAKLRRSRKPMAARELLRDAVKIFHDYHAEPWAKRATAELRAAGESVSPPEPGQVTDLTAQQLEIAHLVAEGATNREIATQLFISSRTVDHHLRNIFARLGVRSRVELAAQFK